MQSGPPPPRLPKIQPQNGACLPRRFSALLCGTGLSLSRPRGFLFRTGSKLSLLPSLFPLPLVPWDGSEVSRSGQGGVFLVSSAGLLSKAPGMGFQLLNPGAAAARTLRTRCGGCGDSLGAQGFGTSPFAASALPPPSSAVSLLRGLRGQPPFGLPGPPPPPSGLSHPSRLSAAPTPTLQRRCVPRALARLPLQLSAPSAFKRSPGWLDPRGHDS